MIWSQFGNNRMHRIRLWRKQSRNVSEVRWPICLLDFYNKIIIIGIIITRATITIIINWWLIGPLFTPPLEICAFHIRDYFLPCFLPWLLFYANTVDNNAKSTNSRGKHQIQFSVGLLLNLGVPHDLANSYFSCYLPYVSMTPSGINNDSTSLFHQFWQVNRIKVHAVKWM